MQRAENNYVPFVGDAILDLAGSTAGKTVASLGAKIGLRGATAAIPVLGQAATIYFVAETGYYLATGKDFSDTLIGRNVNSASEFITRKAGDGIEEGLSAFGYSDAGKSINGMIKEYILGDNEKSNINKENMEKTELTTEKLKSNSNFNLDSIIASAKKMEENKQENIEEIDNNKTTKNKIILNSNSIG